MCDILCDLELHLNFNDEELHFRIGPHVTGYVKCKTIGLTARREKGFLCTGNGNTMQLTRGKTMGSKLSCRPEMFKQKLELSRGFMAVPCKKRKFVAKSIVHYHKANS